MTPGTRFGRYEIESVIRHGGMGAIYLARDTTLQRNVALKVLGQALQERPEYRERFLRESRLAASLDHPHILPIFEAGESEGVPYLAMRYVDGSALDEVIRAEGAMEPGRAVRLIRQIADALDAAHEAGLVHRDVKPANILIAQTASGEHAYLTDFGVAKSMVDSVAMTRAGDLVGTVEYIAPEQIEGRPLDQRVDVYSLGCVLYELLTGRPPFRGDTQAAVLFAHVQSPRPSVRDARAELPVELDEAVQRGMAIDPDQRQASAGALARDAERAIEGRPVAVPASVEAGTDDADAEVAERLTVVARPIVSTTEVVERPPMDAGTTRFRAVRPKSRQGAVIAAIAIALVLMAGGVFLVDRLGAGSRLGSSPPSGSDPADQSPVAVDSGFSCARQEIAAPSNGRWRLWQAEFGARERWDYLKLKLRREGGNEQPGSATAEVMAPERVRELTDVEPPPGVDTVLVIAFNGAVGIGGPWQAQPGFGGMREFRVARGREGNVYVVVGIRGDGCFSLGGQAWQPAGSDDAADIMVEIAKR